jgi:hypothetical protein
VEIADGKTIPLNAEITVNDTASLGKQIGVTRILQGKLIVSVENIVSFGTGR